MPFKERYKRLTDVHYSASMSTITVDERKWKPSCNKPVSKTVSSSLVSAISPDAVADWYSEGERIDYYNSRYQRFNRCQHVRTIADNGPQDLSFVLSLSTESEEDGGPNWTGFSCANSQYIWQRVTETKTLRVKPADYLQTEASLGTTVFDDFLMSTDAMAKINFLARTAIEEMTPKLDDGFSAPVFIKDLIELRALGRAARSLWEATSDVLWAAVGGGTIKDISSTYLAHQFGLKPLVSDIKKFLKKYNEADSKILAFLENEGKTLTYHYEKKLDATEFRDPSWFGPTTKYVIFERSNQHDPWYFAKDIIPFGFTLWGKDSRTVTDLEYHATMKFSYRLPKYGQAMKAFLASLDLYGVNVSVSDLWEIVPFSFLLDWVFDVSSWLESHDFVNLPVTVDIIDFADSISYKREDKFSVDSVTPSQWQTLDSTLSRTKECYYRWPGTPPDAFNGPKWEEVNSRHNGAWRLSILSALAVNRVKFTF